MNHEEYQCAACGGVFAKAWTDEEAEAEAKENFGDLPPGGDREVVCDGCYRKMMGLLIGREKP